MNGLADDVRRIIVETARLRVAPESIALDAPLHGGGLDLASLEVMEVILALEEHFGIEVPDDRISALNSVGAIVALLEDGAGAR
jgi:acyl carrier protein